MLKSDPEMPQGYLLDLQMPVEPTKVTALFNLNSQLFLLPLLLLDLNLPHLHLWLLIQSLLFQGQPMPKSLCFRIGSLECSLVSSELRLNCFQDFLVRATSYRAHL